MSHIDRCVGGAIVARELTRTLTRTSALALRDSSVSRGWGEGPSRVHASVERTCATPARRSVLFARGTGGPTAGVGPGGRSAAAVWPQVMVDRVAGEGGGV